MHVLCKGCRDVPDIFLAFVAAGKTLNTKERSETYRNVSGDSRDGDLVLRPS